MKPKILIAEKESIIALDIKCQLEELGYSVFMAPSIEEGTIDHIKQITPDLIMTNVKISENSDGINIVKDIRKDFDVPVVFLTSQSDQITLDEISKLKNSNYLLKPFLKDELHSTVEAALDNFHGDTYKEMIM